MPSNKSFRTKRLLGKKLKQNRAIPRWYLMKGVSKTTYNFKRRNWRHAKLNI
ncbi:60S ribosomal protein L39 [Coemansia sp. RSA 552]|nr:60S ribosomal protein L39 [Coemansia sp. RSA 552]